MLEINKSITIVGNSKFDGVLAKVFDAKINENDPENIVLNSYITNYELYKVNRSAITAEQTQFEDAVYALQESMMVVPV